MADVTFDGNKDLLVYLGQFGNQGVEYWDAYVWNEVKQKFLFVPSFHDIPNPTLNEKEKIIESFSRECLYKKNFCHTLRESEWCYSPFITTSWPPWEATEYPN